MKLEEVLRREKIISSKFSANLHIHSYKSDGFYSPAAVVKYIKRYGDGVNWNAMALTDHDTVSGVEEAIIAGKKYGLIVIPGIEITTKYKGHQIHLLGYDIDINNKELNDTLKIIRKNRVTRVKEMVKKLNKAGIEIDYNELNKHHSDSIGKKHIADILIRKGYSGGVREACREFLNKGKVAYVDYETIDTREAIRLVLNSGGTPIIAHPGEKDLPEGIIFELISKGLKGLEIFTPKHGAKKGPEGTYKDDTWKYLEIAKKYGLLVTGGTDFHDPGSFY